MQTPDNSLPITAISDDEVKNLTLIYTQPIMSAVQRNLGVSEIGQIAINQMTLLALKVNTREKEIQQSVPYRLQQIEKRLASLRQIPFFYRDRQYQLFNEVDKEFNIKIKRDRSMSREDLIRQIEDLIKDRDDL